MTSTWIPISAYVAGYFATVRILWQVMPKRIQEEDGPFGPIMLGLLWPLVAVTAAVIGFFWAWGWLVMLPGRRRAERAERQELAVLMAGRHVRR